MDPSLTYSSYLRIPELLDLQTPQSRLAGREEHDEMLFIVIHQVYELWFKQLLHEVDRVTVCLDADDVFRSGRGLRRMLTILKVLVSQMDVLETMSPLEFLTFRQRLDASSGFQSAQFREFEFVLGHKRPTIVADLEGDVMARQRLERRLRSPSLWYSVCELLRRRGCDVGPAADVLEPTSPNPAVQRVLVDLYSSDAAIADLCERLVDLDEGVQEWRYRHVKMVERTIGNKTGTGGSSGVEYLASTLGRPLFPDLWAIRSQF
jgi:tryptophan 2,3-dioxygenase